MNKKDFTNTMEKGFYYFKRIFFPLVAICCFCFVFESQIYNWSHPAQQLSYSATLDYITLREVEKITLYSNDKSAEIFLKDDNNRYITTIPNEEVFLQFVQETMFQGNSNLEINSAQKNITGEKVFAAILGLSLLYLAYHKEKTESNETSNNMEIFEQPSIYFSDIAGLNEEKEELMEIVDFLKNPKKYQEMGAKIPKGVLLSGPPGTGKTLLAKAVATEAEVTFIYTSGAEFEEMYVGTGAAKVRTIFEQAKQYAPSIIFIDEIDAIGQKRNNLDNRVYLQTIEQLLTEMDGFGTENNVIVLAATNRAKSLDPALVRPGRFDRTIKINLPNLKGRLEILKIHSKNKKFTENVNLRDIARETSGFSGAELENLLNEAALIAIRRNKNAITKEIIDEALRKISLGLKKNGKNISEKEKKLTAYHEAGHAIVGKFVSNPPKIKEISISPRSEAGGYTWHEYEEETIYESKKELEQRLIVLLGGRAAEQVALNDISSGASNDLEVATDIAKHMICIYGMNSEIGPISFANIQKHLMGSNTLDLIFKLIGASIKKAEKEATDILLEHRNLLDIVSNTLLEKETISGEEFEKILETYQNNSTIINCN